jgi:hypothetical protein
MGNVHPTQIEHKIFKPVEIITEEMNKLGL